ncbi:MAG TPA: hypothetical protein VF463_11695 [Sphingobium sp.]
MTAASLYSDISRDGHRHIDFQYEALLDRQKVASTGNVNNLFNQKYWGQSNFGEGITGSLGAKILW